MGPGIAPFESLVGATSTGAGSVLDLFGIGSKFQLVISGTGYSTSNPFSSVVVDLQGSLDGNVWYTLLSQTTSTGDSRVMVTVNGLLARFVRANVVQLVPGGGSPVITAFIAVGGE